MNIDTFSTERLCSERLRESHLPDYLKLLRDRRVTATLTPDGAPLADDVISKWLGYSIDHWERNGFGFWAFRNKADGQFVGRSGLKQIEMNGRQEVELSYALVPEFWGQGLATEIAEAIAKQAFKQIGLEELICYTLPNNLASRRVMEKVGFHFEEERQLGGDSHVFYRLTASEFAGK